MKIQIENNNSDDSYKCICKKIEKFRRRNYK